MTDMRIYVRFLHVPYGSVRKRRPTLSAQTDMPSHRAIAAGDGRCKGTQRWILHVLYFGYPR